MSGQKAETSAKFPKFIKQEMKNINLQARGLYDNPATAMIPDLDKWTTQGIGNRAQIAGSGNTVGGAGSAEAMRILNGEYLDVTKNPAYQRNINDALGVASQRFSGSGRVGSGAYAGALGDAATGTAAQMYNVERGRQMDALGMMPQLVAGQYADASALEDAGRAIDENNMARFDWPYARLDRYANTVYGSPASQNPSQKSKSPFDWGSAITGLLGATIEGAPF